MSRTVSLISALAIAATAVAPTPMAVAGSPVMAGPVDTQTLNLPRGRSAAIDLPVDARDVIVSNPAVAETMLHSPRRITVIGLAPGETDAVFLDAAGRPILNLSIRVDAGVHALGDTLSRLMPGSDIRVEAVNESVILTGSVTSPGESDRATQIARQFVSAPERVLNMLNVAGSDQVMLRVRVVEVQRNIVKQLGVDLSSVISDGDGGVFRLLTSATFGINGSRLGGGSFGYSNPTPDSVTGALQAFERAGLVRTLAEPNLMATNGENGDFLAGGEFPVPSGRDQEGNIQIQFKPYGVRLAYRPVVLSEGRISLQLSTEVSELTTDGAFTLGGTGENALVIPALNVRRTQTTVEMPSGSALMISGLLREQTRQTIDGVPGLASVPVLGSLFRSRDYLSGETELVFIIEPYIVSPTSPGRLQTPADGLQVASDAQSILFGQLNRAYGGAPAQAASGGWQGPVGYVIE